MAYGGRRSARIQTLGWASGWASGGALAGAWLSIFAMGGCHRAFACEQDEQCRLDGVDGMCEASGSCSFPDRGCASGRRYGAHASAGLVGSCVDDASTGSSSDTGLAATTTSGATTWVDGSGTSSSSEDGPAVETHGDACDGLRESGPVVAMADGEIIEGLCITAHAGPGIDVDGHTGVTIRNCEIHHSNGPGISFRAAHDLTIEDVVVVHDGALAAGQHSNGNQVNVEGRDSTGVVLHRVRATRGSSGITLEATPEAALSFIEVHDVRGPGAAACVRLLKSDDAVLEDFSCENPLDTGRPGDLIAIDQSSRVTVRRGLLDGHNAEFGYGVRFIQISGQHSGGLVEDVDGVRMTNGSFSCYNYGREITFRRTRARDNICEIVSVPIPGCNKPVEGGGCIPNSNAMSWVASPESVDIVIEDSTYFALCANTTWPTSAFTIEPGALVEEDFEPRAPIRLEMYWES